MPLLSCIRPRFRMCPRQRRHTSMFGKWWNVEVHMIEVHITLSPPVARQQAAGRERCAFQAHTSPCQHIALQFKGRWHARWCRPPLLLVYQPPQVLPIERRCVNLQSRGHWQRTRSVFVSAARAAASLGRAALPAAHGSPRVSAQKSVHGVWLCAAGNRQF